MFWASDNSALGQEAIGLFIATVQAFFPALLAVRFQLSCTENSLQSRSLHT